MPKEPGPDMHSREWKYCPWCSHGLVETYVFGANRMACPNCEFIYFPRPNLVAMVIVEHQGKILLGKRNMEPGKGKWTLLGGFVSKSERVEEAAVREIKEETNLDVQLEALLGLYDDLDTPLVLAVYSARVKNEPGELTRQAEEIRELAFFTVENLPELAFPSDKHIIDDWIKSRSKLLA
jgi:8-oxo-dGTP diphosphatase